MLERDRLEYYFSLTHELPEVEFKGPGRRGDNPLFGRVVRGAIALANRRGGGTLIIGVSETGGALSFDGLTPEQSARLSTSLWVMIVVLWLFINTREHEKW